jgi:hypothetical protein
MAGRNVSDVTVTQRMPTTAKPPKSRMALIRFAINDPNPIDVTTAEMQSGSQTRMNARTTTSSRLPPAGTCS